MKQLTGSCHGTLVFLAEDVVVFEILTRLPAGDVLKCRTVCKRWKSMISSPRFVVTQAARAPSMIILQNCRRSGEAGFHLLDLGERVNTRKLSVGLQLDMFQIIGSCNGLLFLSSRTMVPFLLICSPLTRRRIFLIPRTRVDRYCGFFFHPLREIYKVIVASLVDPGEAGLGYHYRVLSFWDTSSSINLVERGDSTLVGTYSSVPTEHPAIYINASFHWVLENRGSLECCIMIFDTEREKMEFRDGPNCCCACRFFGRYNAGTIGLRLLQMGESLGFSHVGFGFVDLWILKDYENWSWQRMHKVNLEQHLGFYHDRTLVEPSSIQNGKLLLICYKRGFFSFNLETRRLRKLNFGVASRILHGDQTIISTTYQDCLAGLDISLSGFILSSRMTMGLAYFPS